VEAAKMVVEYQQVDGSTQLFGLSAPGGPLSGATGQILRGWHSRCYHAARKREARGDAVTGRVLTGAPTSYQIGGMVLTKEDLDLLGLTEDEARERSTGFLGDRLQRLRDVAHRVGKAVGDPGVMEAFRAEEHGGPYDHSHNLPMDAYQLREHIRYAHGVDFQALGLVLLPRYHHELHAAARLEKTRALRDADPGHQPPTEQDWRQQLATDIEDIYGGHQ
jgi:hypothetical protein